jgi:sugar phosphate isomerase/epimerase
MRIGIKLEIGFLESKVYRQLYGERDILKCLREWGIKAVETPVGQETDHNVLMEHIYQCCKAGMHVSLHPYSENTPYNPAFFSPKGNNPCRELHQRFFALAAEAARQQQAKTIVNIHPAAGPRESSRSMLVDQSVRFFEWAGKWCRSNAPAVCPVAELQIRPNPDESIQRIGDNFTELLDIVTNSQVDACWDFGHGLLNSQRFGLLLEPPLELQPRIVHVHCHDVNGDDHHPLIFGNVPWKRFLRSLIEWGFNDTVILEITPENFLAAGGLHVLKHTVNAIVEYVEDDSLLA